MGQPRSLQTQAAYNHAKASGYLDFEKLMAALETAPIIPLDPLYDPAPDQLKRQLRSEFYTILAQSYTLKEKEALFERACQIGDMAFARHLYNSFTINDRNSFKNKTLIELFSAYKNITANSVAAITSQENLHTVWLQLLTYGYLAMAQQLYACLPSQQKNMRDWFCQSILPIMGQVMRNRSRQKTPKAIQTEKKCWAIFMWLYSELTLEQQTTLHNTYDHQNLACMRSLVGTACYWGNLEAVKLLYIMQKETTLLPPHSYLDSPFYLAFINNHAEITAWLFEQATPSQQQEYKKLIEKKCFSKAIATGQLKTIRWFYELMQGKWTDFFSIKFFLFALENNQNEIAQFFYDTASDAQRLEMRKKLGLGPIVFVFSERKPSYSLFLKACAKGHTHTAQWIFTLATAQQKKEMIQAQDYAALRTMAIRTVYLSNPHLDLFCCGIMQNLPTDIAKQSLVTVERSMSYHPTSLQKMIDALAQPRQQASPENASPQKQELLRALHNMMRIYTTLYLLQNSIFKVHHWGRYTQEDLQQLSTEQLLQKITEFKRHAERKKHSRTAQALALVNKLNTGISADVVSQQLALIAHKNSHPLAPTTFRTQQGRTARFWCASSLETFFKSENERTTLLPMRDDTATLGR